MFTTKIEQDVQSLVEQSSLYVVWYYIFARILIGLGILIWVIVSLQSAQDNELPAVISFYLIATLLSIMAIMAMFSTKHGRERWFVWSQFVVDAVFVSVILGTGTSFQNPFVVLYCVNILASVSLGKTNDVLWVSLMDVGLYVSTQVLGFWGMLEWMVPSNALVVYVKVISEIFGLLLIGGLSWMMSLQQQNTRNILQKQVQETSNLRRYHIDVLNELPIALYVYHAESDSMLVPQNSLAQLWKKDMRFELNSYKDQERWSFTQDGREYSVHQVAISNTEKLVLVEDVTLIREMETIVAKEEKLAIVGRLAASLAHEIRNPIASLSGAVQLLHAKENNRLYEIILREVHRINELVELFLESARSTDIRPAWTSIVSSIQEIATALKFDPRCKSVIIDVHDLIPQELYVDVAKIRQILWNLLLNAIQAMPEGGNITIRTEMTDKYIVHIIDNGVGIDAQYLPKLFDPFFSTRAGGTGLGLFVVDQIMQAHNGTVQVHSVVGKGTRFSLHFPLDNILDQMATENIDT